MKFKDYIDVKETALAAAMIWTVFGLLWIVGIAAALIIDCLR